MRINALVSFMLALGLMLSHVAASAAPDSMKVAVQLNWKFQYEFAAPIVAKEMGFYRDVGLDVDLIEGGPDIDPITPVAEGATAFGIAGSSLVVNRASGQPVVALAVLMQHSAVGLLAWKAAGIDSVHDLVGKRLAISFDTADELHAYLQSEGVSAGRFTALDKHMDLSDLASGNADAISVYVSNELFLAQPDIDDYVLLSPRSAGIDLYGNVIFTNESMLKTHPDTVAAFRAATLKGWEYALAHPAEVADIIFARYNSQNKSREHLLFEAEKLRELTRPDIVEPGYMSAGRWRHVAEVYAGQGKIPADFDLSGFLYDPNPQRDLGWVYLTLAGALIALSLMAWVIWTFRRINQKLQTEIEERGRTETSLRLSQDMFRGLVESLSEGVFLYQRDLAGKLTYVSPSVSPTLGHEPEDLLGTDLGAPADAAIRHPRAINVDLQHARQINEIAVQHRDGTLRWLLVYASPLYDHANQLSAVQGLAVDISVQKLAIESQAHARKAAEASNRAKSQFLANISHEIRTPMNGILGMTQLLLECEMDAESREYVQIIYDSAEGLLSVINDILDFSRLEANKLELHVESMLVRDVIGLCIERLAPKAETKGIALSVEIEPNLPEELFADAEQFRQVLNHLLGNAVKFTSSGEVGVHVRQVDGEVQFDISDTGIGISPEHQSHIFEAFAQADGSNTRKYGGTGLGLAICHRLVEKMGGRIWMESELDRGSVFHFTLPLVPQAEGDAPEAET